MLCIIVIKLIEFENRPASCRWYRDAVLQLETALGGYFVVCVYTVPTAHSTPGPSLRASCTSSKPFSPRVCTAIEIVIHEDTAKPRSLEWVAGGRRRIEPDRVKLTRWAFDGLVFFFLSLKNVLTNTWFNVRLASSKKKCLPISKSHSKKLAHSKTKTKINPTFG